MSSAEINPLKVFIGNLNRTTTDEALQAFLGPAAVEVEVARIRKYGWATFSSPAAAEAAVKKSGGLLDGRPLTIKPYTIQPPKPAREPRAAPAAAAAAPAAPSNKVSIVGLPAEINEEGVKGIFAKYGKVEAVALNQSIGRVVATLVTFSDSASASASLVLDKATVNGSVVSVRLLRPRKPRAAAATVVLSTGGAKRAPAAPSAVPDDSVAVLGFNAAPAEAIAALFAPAGEIDSIRFKGAGKVAIVKFVSPASVAKALALSGSSLGGGDITVELPRPTRRTAPAPPRAQPAAPAGGAGGAPAPRAPRVLSDPSLTVWLGPLAEGTSEDAVKAALAKFGTVNKVFLGKEKPFAFVTFDTASAASAATAAPAISVGTATAKAEAQRGRVYVGGLAPDATDADVTAALAGFGSIVSADVRGTSAFVVFTLAAAAAAAIKAGSVTIKGTPARVEAPRPRRYRGPRRSIA